jgi:hypothetical protein
VTAPGHILPVAAYVNRDFLIAISVFVYDTKPLSRARCRTYSLPRNLINVIRIERNLIKVTRFERNLIKVTRLRDDLDRRLLAVFCRLGKCLVPDR